MKSKTLWSTAKNRKPWPTGTKPPSSLIMLGEAGSPRRKHRATLNSINPAPHFSRNPRIHTLDSTDHIKARDLASRRISSTTNPGSSSHNRHHQLPVELTQARWTCQIPGSRNLPRLRKNTGEPTTSAAIVAFPDTTQLTARSARKPAASAPPLPINSKHKKSCLLVPIQPRPRKKPPMEKPSTPPE